MRKTVICSLAIALIVSTTAAFGAVKEGSFTFTPLVGGYSYVDDPSDETTLVFGARAGYNFTKTIGIEAVYDYVTSTNDLSGSLFSTHRFGGQALYHFFPDSVLVPYLAAGYSGIHLSGDTVNGKTLGAFDYGVGAKYFLNDDFALRGDVRHIIYKYNSGTMNNVEFTLGAYIQFGGAEPVMKAIVPAPAPEPIKVVAAPAPVPEPVKPIPAPAPVPAEVVIVPIPVPPADSDSDGVIDTLDKCPGTPAGVVVDNNGCPIDTDKDGVPDYLDKCPATPVGVAVDAKGCPIDSDNDGVADYLDKCPGTPAGVAVSANGCPVEAAKRFCDKPAVIEVSFDTNKTDLNAK